MSLYNDNARDKAALLRSGQAQQTYLALLERTAQLLAASNPQWVALEPLSEVADCTMTPAAWMQLQRSFVEAARRGDPALTVVVSGPCYSDFSSLSSLTPLSDHNVLYSFLYVEPLLFTQQGNPQNPDWTNFHGVPYPYTTAQLGDVLRGIVAGVPDPQRRQQVQQAFSDLAQSDFSASTMLEQLAQASIWAKQNGVTVLLSAFAVHDTAPRADRVRWLRDVRQTAEANHMPWAVWTWQSPYGFGLSENGTLPADLSAALGLP